MVAERNYQWYKKKMEAADVGNMKILSRFARDCPELYQRYRQQYQTEKDEERRKHNYKMLGYL